MRRIFLVLLALAALAVPTSAGAAACRTADSCKSLEHDSTANAAKTVNVDAAGTVLVGGSGSRVELLASGAHTDITATTMPFVTFDVPAWAHSVVCTATVTAQAGTAATNLKGQIFMFDVAANPLTTTAVESGIIASVSAGVSSILMDMGPQAMVFGSTGTTTTAVGAIVHGGISFCPRRVRFSRVMSSAPGTSWSVRYECYGVG